MKINSNPNNRLKLLITDRFSIVLVKLWLVTQDKILHRIIIDLHHKPLNFIKSKKVMRFAIMMNINNQEKTIIIICTLVDVICHQLTRTKIVVTLISVYPLPVSNNNQLFSRITHLLSSLRSIIIMRL